MTDDPLDLQPIEQRRQAITPGPWVWESISEKSNEFAVGVAIGRDGKRLSGRIIDPDDMDEVVIERRVLVGMNESGHAHFADAEFIAHAPEDIDLLLSRVRALEAELAQKDGELEQMNMRLRDEADDYALKLANDRAEQAESTVTAQAAEIARLKEELASLYLRPVVRAVKARPMITDID